MNEHKLNMSCQATKKNQLNDIKSEPTTPFETAQASWTFKTFLPTF